MAKQSWFDAKTEVPNLEEKVAELDAFASAMADGKIEGSELAAQEKRLVAAMKAVEKELDDKLHAKVTKLLVELSAYDIMRTVHELARARR